MKQKEFSAKEVGQLFHVTGSSIKNWVKRYKLPCTVTAGGHYKFTQENIDEIKLFIKDKWGLD